MAFNNEIMVASGGDEQHPGEPTIENIPGGGSQGGVTGVKGNAESTYRDGNVNITQDNIVGDTSTNDISDSDVFITKEGNTWYKKAFSKILQYIGIYYGTTAEWEALTTEEKDKYKLIVKTDDNVNAITSAYDIPYGNTSVGNILDKYTPVTLWTGDTGNYAGIAENTCNLSQSYKNFKFLRVYYIISTNGTNINRPMVREVSTEQLDGIRARAEGTLSMAWGYVGGAIPPDRNYVDIRYTSTETVLYIASNYCKIQKIEGVEQIVHTQISSIDNQVFDSEEREIGTFFEKTLYRRTITGYMPTSSDTVYNFTFGGTAVTGYMKDIDISSWGNIEVVNGYGGVRVGQVGTNHEHSFVPIPIVYNQNQATNYWVNQATKNINLREVGYAGLPFWLTLEYTKY